MNAILVRVAADGSEAGGRWNAPADPDTREFVYVPIPEPQDKRFHRGCRHGYDEVVPALQAFASQRGLEGQRGVTLPERLVGRAMHLDPDFSHLTYGNKANTRGSIVGLLKPDDLIVFFAGLRSIRREDRRLIYAIIGLYEVAEIICAGGVKADRWDENAHTRRLGPTKGEIIVRAKRGSSGRLAHYLKIGEYRDNAYRVKEGLLKTWGDFTVRSPKKKTCRPLKNGYIQRSGVPPFFRDAERSYAWFKRQNVPLLKSNN